MYYLRWYGLRVEAALRRAAIQKRGKGRGRRRAAQPDLSVQSSIGATDIMWRIRSALKLGDMGGGGVCAWAFHAAFLEGVGEGVARSDVDPRQRWNLVRPSATLFQLTYTRTIAQVLRRL